MTVDYNKSSYLIKRLLGECMAPHIGKLVIAVICMFIVASATAANAWLMQPAIDDVFVKKDKEMLIIVSAAAFIVALIKGAASYGQSFYIKYIGQKIVTDTQGSLYEHLINSDITLFNNEASGRLISRFTNDITVLRGSVSNVMTNLAKEILTLIFLIGLMFYQSAVLALIAFAVFPTAIYPVIRLGKKMRKVAGKTQEELGNLTEKLAESFNSIRVIKAYQNEGYEVSRAKLSLANIFRLYVKAARIEALSSPIMEMLGGIAIASVIWYGGMEVINGTTTAGKFFSFIAAFIMAYKPMKSISGLNSSLQEGLAAARRLFIIMDEKPSIIDREGAAELDVQSNVSIKLCDVKFSYGKKKSALNGISMEVEAGKTIALVGPSGGGKSTVMNLLMRFYEPCGGIIEVNGWDIRDITIKSLRKNIAFVSQDISLFDDTVYANIAYGKKDATHEEIEKAADLAAAADFIRELPEGYNSIIGADGLTLSGGQRQRIAIARAILRNAPILLLDEATSALDPISERKIQYALNNLMKGRTTIVIAHRLSTVEHADRIYVLKKGKIVESGVHSELLSKNGEYANLYKGGVEIINYSDSNFN